MDQGIQNDKYLKPNFHPNINKSRSGSKTQVSKTSSQIADLNAQDALVQTQTNFIDQFLKHSSQNLPSSNSQTLQTKHNKSAQKSNKLDSSRKQEIYLQTDSGNGSERDSDSVVQSGHTSTKYGNLNNVKNSNDKIQAILANQHKTREKLQNMNKNRIHSIESKLAQIARGDELAQSSVRRKKPPLATKTQENSMIVETSPIIGKSKMKKINKNTTLNQLSDNQQELQRQQKFSHAKHASQEPIVTENLIFNGELIQNNQAMDDSHFKQSMMKLETEKKLMQKNLQQMQIQYLKLQKSSANNRKNNLAIVNNQKDNHKDTWLSSQPNANLIYGTQRNNDLKLYGVNTQKISAKESPKKISGQPHRKIVAQNNEFRKGIDNVNKSAPDNYTESMKKIISNNPKPINPPNHIFGTKNSSVQIEGETQYNMFANYEEMRSSSINFDKNQTKSSGNYNRVPQNSSKNNDYNIIASSTQQKKQLINSRQSSQPEKSIQLPDIKSNRKIAESVRKKQIRQQLDVNQFILIKTPERPQEKEKFKGTTHYRSDSQPNIQQPQSIIPMNEFLWQQQIEVAPLTNEGRGRIDSFDYKDETPTLWSQPDQNVTGIESKGQSLADLEDELLSQEDLNKQGGSVILYNLQDEDRLNNIASGQGSADIVVRRNNNSFDNTINQEAKNTIQAARKQVANKKTIPVMNKRQQKCQSQMTKQRVFVPNQDGNVYQQQYYQEMVKDQPSPGKTTKPSAKRHVRSNTSQGTHQQPQQPKEYSKHTQETGPDMSQDDPLSPLQNQQHHHHHYHIDLSVHHVNNILVNYGILPFAARPGQQTQNASPSHKTRHGTKEFNNQTSKVTPKNKATKKDIPKDKQANGTHNSKNIIGSKKMKQTNKIQKTYVQNFQQSDRVTVLTKDSIKFNDNNLNQNSTEMGEQELSGDSPVQSTGQQPRRSQPMEFTLKKITESNVTQQNSTESSPLAPTKQTSDPINLNAYIQENDIIAKSGQNSRVKKIQQTRSTRQSSQTKQAMTQQRQRESSNQNLKIMLQKVPKEQKSMSKFRANQNDSEKRNKESAKVSLNGSGEKEKEKSINNYYYHDKVNTASKQNNTRQHFNNLQVNTNLQKEKKADSIIKQQENKLLKIDEQNKKTNMLIQQFNENQNNTQNKASNAELISPDKISLWRGSEMSQYRLNETSPLLRPRPKVSDFEIQELIGIGNFGTVHKAWNNKEQRECALKIIKKESVAAGKQIDHIISEKEVLDYLTEAEPSCPFTIKFFSSFKDRENLYFELEYIQGCTLLSQIRQYNPLVQQHMTFYGCEMILTLEYLHSHQIIYRDLKPENIILNMKQNGHISLVDFGFSKFCRNPNAKCITNCGTPVYIAPEILRGSGYSYEADIWSLGVLMVEIASGQTPFYAENTIQTYEKIMQVTPKYTRLVSQQLRDLLEKIFVADPDMRISLSQIKNHVVFKDIDWDISMLERFDNTCAPFIPKEAIFGEEANRASEQPLNKPKNILEALMGRPGDDTEPLGQPKERLSFDQSHFDKFLREDNQIASEEPNTAKRRRQNPLGDFKFKRINEYF